MNCCKDPRKVEERGKEGMVDVAKGEYDTYIQNRSMGRPVFVRLSHEMNDPYRYPWGPHNNSTKNFIAAKRQGESAVNNLRGLNLKSDGVRPFFFLHGLVSSDNINFIASVGYP